MNWLLLALLFVITDTAETEAPFFLGDAALKANVQRMVSLAPSITEMLFALNVGDNVVGVTRFDDFPAQVKKLPIVGGYIDPSVEAIVALKPDLVVCVKNPGGRDRLEVLTRLNIPVLVMPENHLMDIFTNIRYLGKLFNKTPRAETLINAITIHIHRIESNVRGLEAPRTLLIYGHKPLVAAGPGSFGDEMLQIAGAKNVAVDSSLRYPNLPMENVIRLAPEVIIDASISGTGAEISAPQAQDFWSTWQIIPAVKNKRVYIFDSALWFRPGPRIAEGIERLAKLLHPTLVNKPE